MERHIKLWLVACLCLWSSWASAATYYISTTGWDDAAGTLAQPWRTVTHAVTNVAPGDTIFLLPGVYNEIAIINVAGTAASPILWKASGAVTNLGTWEILKSYNVIDGFQWTARGTTASPGGCSIIFPESGVTNVSIINCLFHDIKQGLSTVGDEQSCIYWRHTLLVTNTTIGTVISNCTFMDSGASRCIFMRGYSNIVVANTFSNLYGGDVIWPYGGHSIMRDNRILEHGNGLAYIAGCSNQTWNGKYRIDEARSLSWSGGSRMYPVRAHTNVFYGNHLFIHCENPGTYGLPAEQTLANGDKSVFYAGAAAAFGPWYTISEPAELGSLPTESAGWVNHPDAWQVFGPTENAPYDWANHSFNHLFERNYIKGNFEGAIAQTAANDGGDTNHTVIHTWTFRNELYIDVSPASISFQTCRWYNCTIAVRTNDMSALSFAYYVPSGKGQGCSYGAAVYNCAFLTAVDNSGWYTATESGWDCPNIDLWTNCNYNYVGVRGSWTQCKIAPTWYKEITGTDLTYRFYEPNGINGGNPGIISLVDKDFRLLKNSLLIDKGTNLSQVTADRLNVSRPKGTKHDIGAFESDPNLMLWYDFEDDFVSAKYIRDQSGTTNHAYNYMGTNWIRLTNGPGGRAGLWGVIWSSNNNDADYWYSQYAAARKPTGIEFLTNGTISVLARWSDRSNALRWDTILDSGDYMNSYLSGSNAIATRTNSWWMYYGRPPAPPIGGESTGVVAAIHPYANGWDHSNTIFGWWPNVNKTNPAWWHLVVTFASSNGAWSYENGSLVSTHAFNYPFLRVGGADTMPGVPPTNWLCVGAMQHAGTPGWNDDKFPNSGWFKGAASDIRIYNRVLATNEIVDLYNSFYGTPSTPVSGEPPTPEESPDLLVSPSSITEYCLAGSPSFTNFYTVRYTGPGSTVYTNSETLPWVEVVPWTVRTNSGSVDNVTIVFNPSAIPGGTYSNGNISVTWTGATRTVSVGLGVTNLPSSMTNPVLRSIRRGEQKQTGMGK